MSSVLAVFLGAACLGIEVGWRPLPDGGTEYVIRVSPEELADLKLGDVIAASDIPPDLPPIKSYRIEVGRGAVERRVPPPGSTVLETPENAAAANSQRPAPSATIPLVSTEPAAPQAMDRSPAAPPKESQDSADQVQGSAKATEGNPSRQTQDEQPRSTTGEDRVESQTKNPDSLIHTLAISGMTASFAAVLYIGWVAWEYRRKYLELLRAGRPFTPFEDQDCASPSADLPGVSLEKAHDENTGSPSLSGSEESSSGDPRHSYP